MKIPNFKRLTKSDYNKEDQEFIDKLGFIINNSFEVIYEALNRKVDLVNNIACTVRDVTLSVDSEGAPVATASFSLDNPQSKVIGCQVISCVNLDESNVFPTATPFITFTQTNTGILINNVAGLPAGTNFRLKIVAYT